jgi:GGDEF domain-containing protein
VVRNAVLEHGGEGDFIGHLEGEDFVVLTDAERVERIKERIETRVQQSREYFYPVKDRDRVRQAAEADHLLLRAGVVAHTAGKFDDLDALKKALKDR